MLKKILLKGEPIAALTPAKVTVAPGLRVRPPVLERTSDEPPNVPTVEVIVVLPVWRMIGPTVSLDPVTAVALLLPVTLKVPPLNVIGALLLRRLPRLKLPVLSSSVRTPPLVTKMP